MEQTNQVQAVQSAAVKPKKKFHIPVAKVIYNTFVGSMFAALNIGYFAMPASATSTGGGGGVTIWTKANEIMKDVYSQILLISTIAAVVTASVALLLMNFSRNGRTVDESRAWLKRIIVSWAILNGLGFIMAYVTPFFADGKWNG